MARSRSSKVNTISFGFYAGRGNQTRMERADQHNEIEVNFVERGKLTFRHGPLSTAVRSGGTILYWAAIPHQVVSVAPNTKICWLVFPLSWFISWNLPANFSAPLLNGEIQKIPEKIGRTNVGDFLGNLADDFASNKAGLRKILPMEVEIFFRRMALDRKAWQRPQPKSRSASGNRNDLGRIELMVRFITENIAEQISISQIAQNAGLNPEYAMRLFRQGWGMTLWEFVLRQRIFRAKRLLVLSDAKITNVALESGFNSASRFYSAFKKYCGCSPRSFRRQHLPERSELESHQ